MCPRNRDLPEPGRVTRFLMERRLGFSGAEMLLDELEELYQHRAETDGRGAADRWLRREYRGWTWRLLRGSVALDRDPSDSLRPGPPASPGLLQELRHSGRGLRRSPLFTAAVVLTVGLGIGGTTLVFSVVHSVLIAPLPYPGADRMVLLRTVNGPDMWSTSMADLDALYDPPAAFEAIAGYTYRTPSVTLQDGVELVRSKWVTANYFPLLGIEPLHGRGFTPEESRSGAPPVALVTRAFAERAFGPSSESVGRTLVLDGSAHTVVGVIPDRLGPLDQVPIYPALQVEAPRRKGPFSILTLGRIRDGVDREVARQQLDVVAREQFPIWRDSFTLETATLGFLDLKQIIVGDVARTLLMVMTAVAFLLLIASANAASLLVARGIAREREVAIRAALGASGGRLLRLLLGEAAILAGGGALLGLAVAGVGMDVVIRQGLGQLPRVEELGFTAPVLAFFFGVTLASWALFGFVASGTVLRRSTRGVAATAARATSSSGLRRARRLLVALQFAISIPLLVGAGLLGKSLDRLQSGDFGFDPENLVSMLVSLPPSSYPDETSIRSFWSEMLPAIEALPDVLEAGLADARPPVQYPQSNNFVLEDRPPAPDEPVTQAPWITAEPGYFETLGIRLLNGRLFTDPLGDTLLTAVVDQAWSERYYPQADPVGRRFRSGGCTIDGCPWIYIVGVVSNVKTSGLDDDYGDGTIYFDFRRDSYASTNLHLRTRGDPLATVPAVRRLVAERDPTVPIADVMTVEQAAGESLMGRRYSSLLVGLLAGVALLLSVVGIYGAMSYHVRQHARDIGIRIALGGGPSGALRMVILQGMQVAFAGTVGGVLVALGLTRYMSNLLYEVAPTDPVVFLAVSTATLAVALGAIVVPGRAAARTDPALTLRDE